MLHDFFVRLFKKKEGPEAAHQPRGLKLIAYRNLAVSAGCASRRGEKKQFSRYSLAQRQDAFFRASLNSDCWHNHTFAAVLNQGPGAHHKLDLPAD